MARIIGALLLIGLMVVAIKVAIFVAIIVCLMRWPKETIAVLGAMLVITLAGRYPIVAGIPIGIIVLIGIYRVMAKPPDDPPSTT